VTHDRTQIVLLSGKSSNRLGVVKIAGPQSEPLELTNVDRTLIDIAVRPTYAGGAKSVAKAYRNAFSQTSVSRLAKMLGELGYVYTVSSNSRILPPERRPPRFNASSSDNLVTVEGFSLSRT
jgi:hypothetical protein